MELEGAGEWVYLEGRGVGEGACVLEGCGGACV